MSGYPFELVVLISAYRDGMLTLGAIESALNATWDVIVFEGPAGPPLEADVPDTDYSDAYGIDLHEGSWSTDAKKRTAMVEAVRKRFGRGKPVWGVWLDSDEILCNGEWLADELAMWQWQQLADGDERIAWPMLLVERDGGGIVVCRGKCVRIDLIDRYSVSSNVFVNHLGITEAHHGNLPVQMTDIEEAFRRDLWQRIGDAQERARIADQLRELPPLPCQPFLLHRSGLRHPLRRGLRMHEQETVELAKAEREAES